MLPRKTNENGLKYRQEKGRNVEMILTYKTTGDEVCVSCRLIPWIRP